MADKPNRSVHRGSYTLEMGVWQVRCRGCGYRMSDTNRRRLAAIYRSHIRAMSVAGASTGDRTEQSPGTTVT